MFPATREQFCSANHSPFDNIIKVIKTPNLSTENGLANRRSLRQENVKGGLSCCFCLIEKRGITHLCLRGSKEGTGLEKAKSKGSLPMLWQGKERFMMHIIILFCISLEQRGASVFWEFFVIFWNFTNFSVTIAGQGDVPLAFLSLAYPKKMKTNSFQKKFRSYKEYQLVSKFFTMKNFYFPFPEQSFQETGSSNIYQGTFAGLQFDDSHLLVFDGKLHEKCNIFTKEDDGQGRNRQQDACREGSINSKSKGYT